MLIKARNIKTNEIIFQGENGEQVSQKAKESGIDYILDFEETRKENLQRIINRNLNG